MTRPWCAKETMAHKEREMHKETIYHEEMKIDVMEFDSRWKLLGNISNS